MKTLLLMRHAKSSWKSPELDDQDRPLSPRGRRDAARMGRLLRDQILVPDMILSSTARRARKTAAKVLEAVGGSAIIELRSELYGANPAICVKTIHEVYHDLPCLLFVGHNPCLEELLAELICRYEPLPAAAIAHLELPISSWRKLTLNTEARLVGLWRPRELE